MRSKILVAYFCLAALLTSYSYAAESTYKYEVVAQQGSKVDGITLLGFETVAMNDLDTVVFTARYNDGSYAGASGVFSRSHALLKKGDIIRGLTVVGPRICGINDFDELAMTFSYGFPFSGTPSAAAIGKFVRHGKSIVPEGKLVKVGDTIDGLTIQSFRECAFNDMGEVVFSADYVDSSGAPAIGVFTRNRMLLKAGSEIQGIPLSGFIHLDGLSDSGTVVFDSNLGTSQTSAFTQHRVLALPGDTIHKIPLLTAFSPVISHFGRVAFSGEYEIQPNCNSYNCMGFAVFGPDGVVAKTGDTISGITLSGSVIPTGINDAGVVLMQANFGAGYGLFTKDSVIAATGDTVAGFLVGGFGNSQINEFGDVAFSLSEAVLLAKHQNGHEKHK